ncbi:iron complex transport system substrate-binding protein (plasmid) [Ketogulonicigenium robustum]|uniref:Iron complex transport system substrate-binding protein n=1 Tax=Ketogulonicigenium robustum TaxID=92947 RepID=A0A1W6P3K9_9RHOB|nr:ABC transporter substrate-binding protein [Ketogulonicigenium robustum]ARO16009.1 iron complex transport system substrate-binding protein [Ketogulonicigenium robustum]
MKLALIATLLAALGTAAAAQDTRTWVDDAGISVEVPTHPQRIVSMHDSSLTTPLIELGVIPVGSFSRTDSNGQPFMRGTGTLSGVTFENSGITPIGGQDADLEAIAALAPDLIVMSPFTTTPREKLEVIAPTVLVADNMRGELATFEDLAALTGTEDKLAILKERYANQIAQLRDTLDGRALSASILLVYDGEIQAWHTYGVLGKVLRDAGFTFPDILNSIEGDDRVRFSGERLQDFDADLMFLTYLSGTGGKAEVEANLDTIMPGYCTFLHACQNEQIVYLPREEAVARSYTAAGMMAAAIGAIISSKTITPAP